MSLTPLLKPETILDERDPNQQQNRAADPGQSVWVAASAGSGKTKVLTDRVLRLLLPPAASQPGTRAEKILCLTFTKAGAAEMAVRITKALAAWAVQDETALHASLSALLARNPRADEMEAARRLFAQVIDSPGGLKILTIHSFCQSILGRFPLEAGLSPQASVADENAVRPLQQKALETVLAKAEADPKSPLYTAMHAMTREKGEGDLATLFQSLMGERTRLARMVRHYGDLDQIYARICETLGVSPEDEPESLLRNALIPPYLDESALRSACTAMGAAKTKTMQERCILIQQLLDAGPNAKPALYPAYKTAFLTQKGEILARLVTKDVDPEIGDILRAEAERIIILEDQIKAANAARQTRNLLHLGMAVLDAYEEEKSRRALLDYDDLIAYTLRLLQIQGMHKWVMFKLDQGIDHILVDEAQDTNPEQWDIIHALCAEFFEGDGARADMPRTIFAVGDEKQSIFGFQRAAPEKFRSSEAYYKDKAAQAERLFDSVPMNISFRSTASVLALTDAVFGTAAPWLMLGLPEGKTVQHFSHRTGQAGYVELWPLIRTTPVPDPEPWTPPVTIEDSVNAEALLSEQIAGNIRGWLDRGDRLEAYDRAITPGDILILVRSRGSLVERLVRALKSANIPVSGVDRMVLGDQIAVMDLLAAAKFALLPEDDLSLACLLKSPLIGISEDDLFRCANGRSNSLWQSVKEMLHPDIATWLNGLIARAGTVRPYEFFSLMLHMPCPADMATGENGSGLRAMTRRLGEDCLDPLEEFLNLTLQYEVENIPSLQKFLHWQEEGDTTIKRELESAGGKIRIMTVHASKGLQAPIVILPDTAHSAASIGKIGTSERLIWVSQESGAPVPLWSPRGEDDCKAFTKELDERRTKLTEEYNRLLYVALTRAADRLYVAGCVKNRDPAPHCWYNLVEDGFRRLEQDRPDAFSLEPLSMDVADSLGFRLSNPQIAAPDKIAKTGTGKAPAQPACDDWSWLNKAPPEEETPPRPWTPSRPSETEPAMRSPLDSGNQQDRFRRGLVTHSLLQFLPNLPPAQWEKAATQFVAGQDLRDSIKGEIVAETLRVLTHPDFAAVFGPGSMAEIPITALLENRLISGQIDRMLITDSDILIVDFKTNRPPPTQEKDVPAIYRSQLRAYRDTLARIYPNHNIRCFLLWTDGPHMMAVKV